LFRAPKAATTNVCPTNTGGGGGGGGGGNGCSSTLTPADVLFGQASTGAITTLAINTGGKNLSLMCTTATAGLGQIVVANVSATNKNFLYALSVATNAGIRTGTLRGFAIGHVTPVTLTPVVTDLTLSGSNVLQIAEMQADPAGRFITVTDSSLNFVHVLLIDPNSGVLTEASGSPLTVTNALFTAVDTTGKFLYVTDNPDGEIFIFTIDLVNPMLQITNSPFLVSITPANLPISMLVSGSFLYTANDQSISFFAIGADGSLSQVGSNLVTPVPTFNPQLLALDPTGRFLYVTGSGTEGVLGYSINSSTGALTIIPGGPFAAGSNVTDILPNPFGGQMYLLNAGVIEVFTVDPNSGALTLAAGASQFASSSNLATANVQ
jgi:6-phosphogluconolactonase (cycloisomerase 2 family)